MPEPHLGADASNHDVRTFLSSKLLRAKFDLMPREACFNPPLWPRERLHHRASCRNPVSRQGCRRPTVRIRFNMQKCRALSRELAEMQGQLYLMFISLRWILGLDGMCSGSVVCLWASREDGS
jgi:hypothetical protein